MWAEGRIALSHTSSHKVTQVQTSVIVVSVSRLLPLPVFDQERWSEGRSMHCNNIQETRGAVMFTDEEYSKQADAVGLGRARPPRRAGRAKRYITDAVTSCDGGNEMEPDCILKWLEE